MTRGTVRGARAAASPRTAAVVAALLLAGGVAVGCRSAPRSLLPTAAAYPTLDRWSRCEVRAEGWRPERGLVLLVTVDGRRTLRRVAGVSGDRVGFRGGSVIVNGVSAERRLVREDVMCRMGVSSRCRCDISEERLGSRTYPTQRLRRSARSDDFRCDPLPDPGEVTVPPGHVYLLADNRDAAEDSRSFGPVPLGAAAPGRVRVLGQVPRCGPAPSRHSSERRSGR